MALSIASLKGSSALKPPIAFLYGIHGGGKTTFAAGAPKPVLAAVEDGVGLLDVPRWDIGSWSDMMEAIGALYGEDHDRQTFILDSLDAFEPHVWREACRKNGWANIEAPGYGKGYVAALELWRELLEGLRALRDERGMTIILIAHSVVKRFEAPDHDPIDRYQPKLHDRASALLQEQADVVGFLNYRVSIREKDEGFGKKATRGVGSGQRVLYLEERPAYLAKNRYSMPPFIDLPTTEQAWQQPDVIWQSFAQHLPTHGVK
ncbi:MAG: hypothetical protein K0R61_744 [Microvirga sp.]|jgi:hypothetical protein|nr:hypothetical protein [Microvirga sp.]MCD6070997.1 hypothetical protein [Microvirga sp.]MDF2970294.1 hypothetical protein [Microvirga sp.]